MPVKEDHRRRWERVNRARHREQTRLRTRRWRARKKREKMEKEGWVFDSAGNVLLHRGVMEAVRKSTTLRREGAG